MLGNGSYLGRHTVEAPLLPSTPLYTLPLPEVVDKSFPLLTLNSLYSNGVFEAWALEHYRHIFDIIFSDLKLPQQGEKSYQRNFLDLHPRLRELLTHSKQSKIIGEILYGSSLIDEGTEEGCLEKGFTRCFTDSEQVFLGFLLSERYEDLKQFSTQLTRQAPSRANQSIPLLRVEFLSHKDVCPFCRGTISTLLHSGLLQQRMKEWGKFVYGLDFSSSEVEVYALSLLPCEKK